MRDKSILFFNADVEFVLRDKNILRKWLVKCAKRKGKKINLLTYVFCSDPYLRKMNKRHLNHDYNTDIITFPDNTADKESVAGEMYISIDRVKVNAKEYGVTFASELRRVMVHGLLHMSGEDDKSEKGAAQMRKEEDACLSLFKKV